LSILSGTGSSSGLIPEWHTGISRIRRIQAAPASKLIQGRVTDSALHRTSSICASSSAVLTSSSHFSPASIDTPSDDTKMSSRLRKSRERCFLRTAASAPSLEMWLTKTFGFAISCSPDLRAGNVRGRGHVCGAK
jgi:hypothetical protein